MKIADESPNLIRYLLHIEGIHRDGEADWVAAHSEKEARTALWNSLDSWQRDRVVQIELIDIEKLPNGAAVQLIERHQASVGRAHELVMDSANLALSATYAALSRSSAAMVRNGEIKTQGEDDQAAMVPA